MIRILFLFSILLSLIGCSPYKWTDRKNLFVFEDYFSDTIVLQDFVFCSILNNSIKKSVNTERPLPYSIDSIINAIDERFLIHGIELKIFKGDNRCDTVFSDVRAFRIDDEIKQSLLEISKNNPGRKQLIPYIFFGEMFVIHYGILRNLLYYPGGEIYRTIRVAMVIVENNEIVYIKTDQHFGKNYIVDTRDEFTPILDFSILQKLIASTIEDYANRVKH